MTIWTNGFHTDLEFAADLLPPSHPLRRLHPGAQRLQLGWGDKAFYQSEGTNMLLGARSLLPGGAVTIHLLDSPGPPIETLYYPSAVSRVAISREGAQRLAAWIDAALVLDANGLPVIERPGHLPGHSLFLAARGDFHAFRVCNHWTADALREAGVPVQSRWAWSGKGLTEAAGRLAPGPCSALGESR